MFKKLPIVAIAIVLLAAFCFSEFAVAQESYEKAKSALKSKNYQSALRYAQETIQTYEDWFWGHYYAGRAYIGLKQYDNAIKSLKKSLDDPNIEADWTFQSRFELARAYYNKRDFKNALDMINTIQKRHKNSKLYKRVANMLYEMEGYANFETKNYKSAISAFKPVIDSGKADADALRAVAKSYQEINDDKNAIKIISQVVQKDSSDISAHKILIKSYVNSKQWSQTHSAISAALKAHDRDWEIYYLQGVAFKGQKKHNSAVSALKKSIAIKSQAKVNRLLADELVAIGNFLESTKYYNAAQKEFSNDPKLYVALAFAWNQYVPKDAENYKGKKEEKDYLTALANAEELLKHAKSMKGADIATITGITEAVKNKTQRLKEGKFIKELYEYVVNPDTGEIEKRLIKGDKK